jgi:tRNA-dihydrouridine synthase
MRSAEEILALIPRLNGYPLEELIIHPRLGIQLFAGQPSLDGFAAALAASVHPVVYNGDINSLEDFQRLCDRFPHVSGWMIGRGAVACPALAEQILNNEAAAAPFDEPPQILPRLAAFHDELFAAYAGTLSGPGHLLGKMKQFWLYFIASFPGQEKLVKTIVRAHSLACYQEAVLGILANQSRLRLS